MRNIKGLRPIGRMAVFYLPSPLPVATRIRVEKFLLDHFRGYTCQDVSTSGAWRSDNDEVVFDSNVRFEVSFAGKDRIPELVRFLREVCRDLDQDAIYLTMGEDSFLVDPMIQTEF